MKRSNEKPDLFKARPFLGAIAFSKISIKTFFARVWIDDDTGRKEIRPVVTWKSADGSSADPEVLRQQFERAHDTTRWRLPRGADPWTVVVCMPTGGNELAVIDSDVKDGIDGETSLFDLQMKHGFFPGNILLAETPTLGIHRVFNDRHGLLKTTKGALGPGLDTRGVGGMIIAPGSKIFAPPEWAEKEGRYRWLNLKSQFGCDSIDQLDRSRLADISDFPWVLERCGPPGAEVEREARGPRDPTRPLVIPNPLYPAAYPDKVALREALDLLDVLAFNKDYDRWNTLQRAITHSSTIHDVGGAAEVFADWSCKDPLYAKDRAKIIYQFKCNARNRNMIGGNAVGTFNKFLIDAGHSDNPKLRWPPTDDFADDDHRPRLRKRRVGYQTIDGVRVPVYEKVKV